MRVSLKSVSALVLSQLRLGKVAYKVTIKCTSHASIAMSTDLSFETSKK